jgi:flagellar biosynthesis protein FliR
MPATLEEFLVTGVFAFVLAFVRIGTAAMIMPGIGDSFVPGNVRLHFALGLSLVLFPLIVPYLPTPLPPTGILLSLIVMEFIIGLFFGTIARIFMTALDTAGMVISFSSSLSNAQLFNPGLAAQGSLVGAFLSVTGALILFAANMHHLFIRGLMESYEMFPVGAIPDSGSMAELMARAVAASFSIGVKLGAPFIVMTLLIYVGMGVLSRLMPQVQVFLLALPIQIILSLLLMTMVLSAGMLYWLREFESGMVFFLSSGG